MVNVVYFVKKIDNFGLSANSVTHTPQPVECQPKIVYTDIRTHPLRLHDFALEPGEVVDTETVLAARDGHQDVLTLEDGHLGEASSADQRVH